jgi:AbrB family looped-hinge helix DNA binding protein
MTSTISSKGQITVPAQIREKLGLIPGTEVEFVLHKNGVFLRNGARDVHPGDRAFGLIQLSAPVHASHRDQLRSHRSGCPPSGGAAMAEEALAWSEERQNRI